MLNVQHQRYKMQETLIQSFEQLWNYLIQSRSFTTLEICDNPLDFLGWNDSV